MLERLVAGLVVIGVLLWGASVLATPSGEDAPVVDEGEPSTTAPVRPPVDAPDLPPEEEDEEEDEEPREERKRKRDRDDDD